MKKNKILILVILIFFGAAVFLWHSNNSLENKKNFDKSDNNKNAESLMKSESEDIDINPNYENKKTEDNQKNNEPDSSDGEKQILSKEENLDNEEVKKDDVSEQNEDKEQDVGPSGTETDENMILIDFSSEKALINKKHRLPEGYAPDDLQVPNLPAKAYTHENKQMRKNAAIALEKMFNAAREDGLILYVISGYRPYELQKSIYDSSVERIGVEETEKIIAIPGSSEHQSGLAMDVSCESENFELNESLGDKPEGIWLAENSYKFGFIIRYPKDKEHITEISYEPWHLRYVGLEMAKEIYEKNICLEEYYE